MSSIHTRDIVQVGETIFYAAGAMIVAGLTLMALGCMTYGLFTKPPRRKYPDSLDRYTRVPLPPPPKRTYKSYARYKLVPGSNNFATKEDILIPPPTKFPRRIDA